MPLTPRLPSSVRPLEREATLPNPNNDDFADLLWGAQAIADYIGKSYRKTVYLLAAGRSPAHKIGSTWVGCRSKVSARLLGDNNDKAETATANAATTAATRTTAKTIIKPRVR
jgi:hypothetical protein